MSLTVEELRTRVSEKASAKGADPTALVESELDILNALLHSTADALGGDARIQAHLEAQLKLGKFSAEAQAFTEGHIWWEALKETLLEVAHTATVLAVELAAKGLAEAMGGSFRG